jgi:hypothetical protein
VSAPDPTPLEAGPDAPEVWLLDARAARLDEAALRRWARQLPVAARAAHRSRAYRHPYALVAWGEGPVGVDLERVEALDQAFLESICTPEERRRPLRGDDAVASLWCSKEALAKALGNALAYDPRRLGSPAFWPGGGSGPWRSVALPVPEGYVGWLCWRRPAATPPGRRPPAARRGPRRGSR